MRVSDLQLFHPVFGRFGGESNFPPFIVSNHVNPPRLTDNLLFVFKFTLSASPSWSAEITRSNQRVADSF